MSAPFCQVCYDTGKPESLYTTHYVTDVPGLNGVVVCPTLLALRREEEEEKEKKKSSSSSSPITCTNCESSSPIDDNWTADDILFKSCTFCSEWCRRDYEYEVRKSYRRSVQGGNESK
jgi:hypothetical protein